MKKSLLISLLFFSICSLTAQNHFYDQYHNLVKSQQIELLKKEKVKKITKSFYKTNRINKLIYTKDEFVIIDTIGNVLNITSQDFDTKKTFTYTYNKSNTLEKEIRTTKKGRFKAKNSNGKYRYAYFPRGISLVKLSNKFYYTYDDKNRLIKKESCNKKKKCFSEITKYFGAKAITSYLDIEGELYLTKMVERKDSIQVQLSTNYPCKNTSKSIIFYNKDSLKLKEERFKEGILTYQEINTIENNKIVQNIKNFYIFHVNSNKKTQGVEGEYYIYNDDSSIKTIFYMRDKNESRSEYKYNDNGLLKEIKRFYNKKLNATISFEYDSF